MKVLIADDEKNICVLLRSLIDWEGLGLCLVGEANDGASAYKQILELEPDIVIIDIRMPEMDGLEVVQKVKALRKETAFLLISGHREFEYAHAAIQYGIENYLLKPIGRQALHTALRQAIEKLETRLEYEKSEIQAGQSREQLHSLLMQHLLYMPEALRTKPLEEIDEFYQVCVTQGIFQVVCIQPDDRVPLGEEQYENLLAQMEAWFLAAFKERCQDCLSRITPYCCYFLLRFTAEEHLRIDYKALLEQALARFYPFCHITMGLSNTAECFKKVNLESARQAAIQRLSLGTDRVIQYGAHRFDPVLQSLNRQEGELWQIMEMGGEQRLRRWFEAVATRTITPSADPVEYVAFLRGMMERYARVAGERLPSDKADKIQKDFANALERTPSREQLLHKALNALLACQDEIAAEKQKRDSTYVWRAKEYVKAHYQESITLEDISRIIFINPTYFSTLFKKEEGVNFSDYLTRYRLEQAKLLLQELPLSVSEIAKRVGYSDTRHFSKIFCKAFGVKPSEYRKLF